MATTELIDEGASLASKGLMFLAKYTYEHFTTEAQLDLAFTALAKSRELLEDCDTNTIMQALKVKAPDEEEIGSHLNYLLVERHTLRGELDHLLEKKHNLKTLFKARTLRANAEDLEMDTQAFSEGIRDRAVDAKFQACLTHDGYLTDIPSAVSSIEKVSKSAGGKGDPLEVKKNHFTKGKVSTKTHSHRSPHLQTSQMNTPVNQIVVNNLIQFFTCPFCPTAPTFTSGPNLTAHMNESHGTGKQEKPNVIVSTV